MKLSDLPLTALLVCLLGLLCGCESTGGPVDSAPVSAVSATEISRAAQVVESQEIGRVSGPGQGQSMQPLYGSNSYVVVDPIDFYDLEPGMVVAYKNASGHNVAHRLLSKDGFYWRVEGINNNSLDNERVTPNNLIGVVYATFHGTP